VQVLWLTVCIVCCNPQVAPFLEQPVGMALYEYRDGQLGPLSVQMGKRQSLARVDGLGGYRGCGR
jgi:hypothetical protein